MPSPAAGAERWDATTARLVDYMIDHEVREAPADILLEFAEDADQMVEAEVLVRTARGYAFFHEGYFDYLAAERFLEGGRPLLEAVVAGEQGLPRRPLIRQVLQAQRDNDFARYAENVRNLLSHNDVRFHLKDTVLSVLGSTLEPTIAEWEAIAHLIEDPRAYGHARAWRVVAHPKWFDLLDSIGAVARWLNSENEEQENLGVSLLRTVARARPQRIARLLKEKLGQSNAWDRRVRWLLPYSDLATHADFVDIAVDLVERGVLDDGGRLQVRDVLRPAHQLPEGNPEGAVRLITALLKRARTLAIDADESNPFDRRAGVLRLRDHEGLLVRTAQAAPSPFVNALLPLMLEMAEANRTTQRPPFRDGIWGYRHVGRRDDIEDQWLKAMCAALELLAVDVPQEFREAAELLVEHAELETALLLLFRAWGAAPSRYADEALRFIIGADDRMAVGYLDHNYWETEQLIKAVARDASRAELHQLEQFLLKFYSWWEQQPEGRRSAGLAQAGLLSAIPGYLRSPEVRARLREAAAKFPERALQRRPQSVRVGFVGSPIEASIAEQMDDDAWLAAIDEYSQSDDTVASDDLRGGAHELAQVLEALAKRDPLRYARLTLKIPDHASPAYFGAVLRALASTDETLEPETVYGVVRRCHSLPNRPCGRWIGRPIARFAEREVPPDLVDLVGWYLTDDPDPERDLWRTGEAPAYFGGDAYLAGINSVRGAAAQDMAKLLWSDHHRLDQVRGPLEAAVSDPVIAVRVCVADILAAVLSKDRDYAVELFQRLVNTDDAVFATRPIEYFMQWASRTHLAEMRPIIQRMMESMDEAAREAGARQACLASLGDASAADLSNAALTGDSMLRRGAAEVFAANVAQAPFRDVCVTALKGLFYDEDAAVRNEASHCFSLFEGAELGAYSDLVQSFIESPAFDEGHEHLLEALRDSSADVGKEAVAAAHAFLGMVGREAGDLQQRAAFDAATVSTLVVRAYRRATEPGIRERALDAIDGLLANQAYGIDEALQHYEAP